MKGGITKKTGCFAGIVFLISIVVFGCQSTYYAVWEKMGKEKRHLLRDRIEDASSEQEKASEQFRDALTRIREMYGMEGSDLEKLYDKLREDYEDCINRSDTVKERISEAERVADDLFVEWEAEINEISNPDLKSKSRMSLNDTKGRFKRVDAAMRKAEKSMKPVLVKLNDYVLYLKHNLNARAIGALKKEADDIGEEINLLIEDMNRSIMEAEVFLKDFK